MPKTLTEQEVIFGEPQLGIYPMIKRLFDFTFSALMLIALLPVFVVTAIAVRMTSKGPALHWSKRIGKDNELFLMPKFRSMTIEAPQKATHLMTNADSYLTTVGKIIRKTSIDEIPQLLSVLKGDMSVVGPRPALFNQDDLVTKRTALGVHKIKPGITGWAQINGRDEIPDSEKAKLDSYYLHHQNLLFDIQIIFKTAFKVFAFSNIKH